MAGNTIGPYRLGKTLGIGSFSKVKSTSSLMRVLHFFSLWLALGGASDGFVWVCIDHH